MSEVEITVASEKGQVVIPKDIRNEIGIKKGTKLAVFGKDDTIVLKKVEMPSKKEFESLLASGRRFAKQKKITKKQVLKDD